MHVTWWVRVGPAAQNANDPMFHTRVSLKSWSVKLGLQWHCVRLSSCQQAEGLTFLLMHLARSLNSAHSLASVRSTSAGSSPAPRVPSPLGQGVGGVAQVIRELSSDCCS